MAISGAVRIKLMRSLGSPRKCDKCKNDKSYMNYFWSLADGDPNDVLNYERLCENCYYTKRRKAH
jgi:hypothetical protein